MTLAGLGLLGSPLVHLLSGQNGGALPRPADLIQQAQALQLLAHLQTVLLQQPGGPSLAGGPGQHHRPTADGPNNFGGLSHHSNSPDGLGHLYHNGGSGQESRTAAPGGQPNLFSSDLHKVIFFYTVGSYISVHFSCYAYP